MVAVYDNGNEVGSGYGCDYMWGCSICGTILMDNYHKCFLEKVDQHKMRCELLHGKLRGLISIGIC